MELSILALLIQMIDTGASFTIEASRRRTSRRNGKLYEALKNLDAESIAEKVGGVELALLMGPSLEREHISGLVRRPDYRSLTNEMFLACLAEGGDSRAVATTQSSLETLIANVLSENATVADAREFAEQLPKKLLALTVCAREALEASDPSLSIALQQSALLKRVTSVLDSIADTSRAIARSVDPDVSEKRDRFESAYRRACAERHGYIVPPDFETNRKVPMDELYVAPNISYEESHGYNALVPLESFVMEIDRTVILGDPGGGKSTLAANIAARHAVDPGARIPFHVTLRDFASHLDEMSLLKFIERELQPRYQIDPVVGFVEDALATGRAIVIFDGLDELIDTSKRREVTRSVELFGIQFPHSPILVTSRRVGYEQARLDPAIFSTFHVDGFMPQDVERYVHNWFASQREYNESQANEQASAFIAQSAAVLDLRSNPLMLALMCIIFRGENYIPRNRPAVYEKCATLLFEKWDGHRGIEVPLQARDHVNAAMKYIAFQFISSNSGESGLTQSKLIELLTDYLQHRAVEGEERARAAAKEFVDYCSGRAWVFTDAGAMGDGEPIFTFTHRTFMEYFAAVHLTRTNDTPEKLAKILLPRVASEEWDVVAQLAVQQVDSSTDQGSSRVLIAMLNERRRRTVANRGNVITFTARCLAFCVVPPALVRDIARAAVKHALGDGSEGDGVGRNRTAVHELRYQTSGIEAEYAAEQVKEELVKACERGESTFRAIGIIVEWLKLGQDETLRGRWVAEPWVEMTVFLARRFFKEIRETAPRGSLVPMLFGWYGLTPPDAVVESISNLSDNLYGRYFEEVEGGADRPRYGSLGATFSEVGDADMDALTDKQMELLNELAKEFMFDFHRIERGAPSKADPDLLLASGRLFPLGLTATRVEAPLSDAIMISQCAAVEIYIAYRGRGVGVEIRGLFAGKGSPEGIDGSISKMKTQLSDSAARFVSAWVEGELSVFPA